MFSKNIRIVYLYAVAFVTLMMIIGGFIVTMSAIAAYIWPSNYNYAYPAYDYSSDAYTKELESIEQNNTLTEQQKQEQISVIDKKYSKEEIEKQQQINDENARNSRLRDIFNALAIILVSLPLYIYHWKRIEKEKKVEV
ncbi:MAG: DUF1542 domain-containing protein [Clostridia bacterium]|nr:DUF1542 domain-containing protein [Clostridia bacterium]